MKERVVIEVLCFSIHNCSPKWKRGGGLFRHVSNRSDAAADDLLHIITRHSGLVCSSQSFHCTVPYIIYSHSVNPYRKYLHYRLKVPIFQPTSVALQNAVDCHSFNVNKSTPKHKTSKIWAAQFTCRLHIVHLPRVQHSTQLLRHREILRSVLRKML
jgi:hypothetical protein